MSHDVEQDSLGVDGQSATPQGEVFIVDPDTDDLQWCAGVLRPLGYIVETSVTAEGLHQKLSGARELPICVLVDIVDCADGFSLIQSVVDHKMPVGLIAIGRQIPVRTVVSAMKLGVADVLEKPVSPELLLAAVRDVMNAASAELKRLSSAAPVLHRIASLSRREREVCQLLAEGLTNRAVAAQLGTAEKTVKHQRGSAFRKLEITSVAELVRILDRANVSQVMSS